MSSDNDQPQATPPEIEAAYKEARERGLPEGWTCSIDKRNRRKWTAPNNGRSCDSIPKALGISVDLGLLPADTIIPTGGPKKNGGTAGSRSASSRPKKKHKARDSTGGQDDLVLLGSSSARSASSTLRRSSNAGSGTSSRRGSVEFGELDLDDESPEEVQQTAPTKGGEADVPEMMDPERTLEVAGLSISERKEKCLPITVHWDPMSPDGSKIGWKIRIKIRQEWHVGRVVRYDPCTHKHKVQMGCGKKSFWIWLRNQQHELQVATRIVWALVKGYAWWPALVMEANSAESTDVPRREGFVTTEFFGTGEVSCVRDSDESIRPFDPNVLDIIVQKHRKKRNQKAFDLACEEFRAIQHARNQAALFYARSAFAMSSYYAPKNVSGSMFAGHNHMMVGRKVRLFRGDVNYPCGDTVVGFVRQYSHNLKKWLVSFNAPENKTKYPAIWMNLFVREHACTVLDKKTKTEVRTEDIIPFLRGFSPVEDSGEDIEIADLLHDRCRGCTESLDDISSGTHLVTCVSCSAQYHLGCVDPPMNFDQYQRMLKGSQGYVCPRCTVCKGCYQKDVAFGSHPHPSPPSTLTIPSDVLSLCFSCQQLYDTEHFCPNCAHTWDDKRFYLVEKQISEGGALFKGRNRRLKDEVEDDLSRRLVFGSFQSDEVYASGFKVEPRCYYPETHTWGFTENEMLLCDSCNVWVHAGCSGLNEKEYNATSAGNHPIFSTEFLCFACCRKRCKKLIKALEDEDRTLLFAVPVSEKVAPNYYDLIKDPMSFSQMNDRLDSQRDVFSYAWVREGAELAIWNALTFNRHDTEIWREAKRFFQSALPSVFSKHGKAAPPSKYFEKIQERFREAEREIKDEEERVQIDESVEIKDPVAGTEAIVAAVRLPQLCRSPPDQPSCIPSRLIKMDKIDAFFSCWMDCCFVCGSSGAADTFLFCVDCGEAFHTFCVGAPIHCMERSSVSGWRCSNCKLCEISGDVPDDEKRMIYCEMCDRAFTLDLLDPPLISAPEGLWICGQCVDCKSCRNSAEKGGASLRFWSQDPEKCFRCGGCTCLVQDYSVSKCQICRFFLRDDDGDFETCSICGSPVHVACDKSLKNSKNENKKAKYRCPSCSRPSTKPFTDIAVQKDRDSLSQLAFNLMVEPEILSRGNTLSKSEHLDALLAGVDWQLRKEWITEYIAIVNDAIKLFCTAKTLGDPRFVIQQVLQRMHQLPPWLGHRALRFVQLVKRQKYDLHLFSTERPDTAVVVAKLAAAFIEVASKTLGTSKEKEVQFLNRMQTLILAPDCNGEVVYPADRLKEVSIEVSFEGNNLVLKPRTHSVATPAETSFQEPINSSESAARDEDWKYIVAAPLSGWAPEIGERMGVRHWKDPRECCLCHLCGDADAGVKSQGSRKTDNDLPLQGRLLPMGYDGYWVHASCAIWSSEVWEEGNSGRLHGVEKARGRGAQLKCFGCGFSGATVGCCKGQCPFNYHFPCAGSCGAVFSADRNVFCQAHRSSLSSFENVEPMKTLIVVAEKSDQGESMDQDLCSRLGGLVIHSLGAIETRLDGFHNDKYITPPGYVSSRIFWSMTRPRSRTVYIMRILKTTGGTPLFTITPCEDTQLDLSASTMSEVYAQLIEKVNCVNSPYFSQGDLMSKLPMARKSQRKTYGLNGPQFFGVGLDEVRQLLESLPNVEAVVAPLSPSSPTYHFCFSYGHGNDAKLLEEHARDIQRKRIAEKAEQSLQNMSGCARCEGVKAVVKSGGSGRITRALVRSVAEDDDGTQPSLTKKSEEKEKAERNLVQVKYREMKSIPMEQRLAARRSHIHGWGLYTKVDISQHDPVVEYTGEIIQKPVADKREQSYELSGEGSCYMFRLDQQRIVDATKIGCMARFMNHSCCPNAYAKIISVDTDNGQDKKIVVFALRDIEAGSEITYDYKFPVEDGSLRCTCGAPNCIGRLN